VTLSRGRTVSVAGRLDRGKCRDAYGNPAPVGSAATVATAGVGSGLAPARSKCGPLRTLNRRSIPSAWASRRTGSYGARSVHRIQRRALRTYRPRSACSWPRPAPSIR